MKEGGVGSAGVDFGDGVKLSRVEWDFGWFASECFFVG